MGKSNEIKSNLIWLKTPAMSAGHRSRRLLEPLLVPTLRKRVKV